MHYLRQVNLDALKALESGRKFLENPSNWVKEKFEDDNGAVCALGAVGWRSAHDTTPTEFAAQNWLGCAIPLESCATSVSGYNDAHGTTHADILRLYDTAISLVRQELGLSAATPVPAPDHTLTSDVPSEPEIPVQVWTMRDYPEQLRSQRPLLDPQAPAAVTS